MNVQDASVVNVVKSAFETVKNASLLIGRNVRDLTKITYAACSKGLKSAIATAKLVWAAVKPVYSKIFAFLKSPAGIASMLGGWSGYCIYRADKTDDHMAKIGLATLSMFSAFSSGVLITAAYLV